MQLKDLNEEERKHLAELISKGIEVKKTDKEVLDFILEKCPEWNFLTIQNLIDFSKSYTKVLQERSNELTRKLNLMNTHYAQSCRYISARYNLTLDEVEEIIERFNKHLWVARSPTFNIIAIYWRIKRLFKGW